MLKFEIATGPQEFHDKLKKIGGIHNVKTIFYLDRLLRKYGYKFDDGFNENIYIFMYWGDDPLPSGQDQEVQE